MIVEIVDCVEGHSTPYEEDGILVVTVRDAYGKEIANCCVMEDHEIQEKKELLESGECPICDRWSGLLICSVK